MKQNIPSKKESVSCSGQHTVPRMTGVVVPLGALKSKSCPVVGEYTALAPFASWCKKAGLSLIQLLPVNDTGTQSSPYSGLSAFALHPVYITISEIKEFSSLYKTDKKFASLYDSFVKNHKDDKRWNYERVRSEKDTMLRALYEKAAAESDKSRTQKASAPAGKTDSALEEILCSFIKSNSWLPAYCVYKNLKWTHLQSSWKSWPENDRIITDKKITDLWNDKKLRHAHLFYAWEQYIAYNQFSQSAEKIRALGMTLKGDLPILMNEDSCDAWSKPELFSMKNRAGSPPDGDNPRGQNWGFPTYNWTAHEKDDFAWWKMRLASAAHFYGAYRLDHILGFFRIWAVPEHETTAVLGHTDPYCAVSREQLTEAGFSKDRIHWMSEPHIPTSALTDTGMSCDDAHAMLEKVCTRLGNEELWNFNPEIQSDSDIEKSLATEKTFAENDSASDSASSSTSAANDSASMTKVSARAVSELMSWWNNRLLIEITKDSFVPSWLHESTQAWKSLSGSEKEILNKIFDGIDKKQEAVWKSHAERILGALTSSVNMIPCGEDLGVNLSCVPPVLEENTILSLNVVRWTRCWSEKDQPYVPFDSYRPLSVTTTSVHDSPTMRQWWNKEKDSARSFEKLCSEKPAVPSESNEIINLRADADFTPDTAEFVLSHASCTASALYVNPLQDWLYLSSKYWLENQDDERINIPGTVSPFNWTYRIPKDIETISADGKLTDTIKKIVLIHDKQCVQQTAEKPAAAKKIYSSAKTSNTTKKTGSTK